MGLSAEATAGAPTADNYLGVDGARLRYRDEGRGTPVLLVHGWSVDLEVWDWQVEALRHAFRVIRYDRRGFGRSSGRPGLEDDIRDIGALLRLLKIERVALVGMSQGTRATVGYAIAHPQRVSCLVLDGPPEFDPAIPGASVSLAPFRALAQSAGLAAFREQWLTNPLMQLRTTDPRARELLQAIVARYPGHELLAGSAEAPPPDMSAGLSALALPVLVMTGEHELAARSRSADALTRRLRQGVRALIPGGGHLSNLDNPESYNRLIAAFLARHANAPI